MTAPTVDLAGVRASLREQMQREDGRCKQALATYVVAARAYYVHLARHQDAEAADALKRAKAARAELEDALDDIGGGI